MPEPSQESLAEALAKTRRCLNVAKSPTAAKCMVPPQDQALIDAVRELTAVVEHLTERLP